MNTIDLVVCILLILAVWNGWRQGFIVQVCSLAALVAGIWLASRFGVQVGALLKLDPAIASAGGFVVVLLAVLLAVALVARIVRKLFHFAGFGLLDIILGIAVSILKYVLLLSVLFSAFAKINVDHTLIRAQLLNESITYRPILRVSEHLFPFLEWIGDQVPEPTEPKKEQ
ncbi:MAG: CvpA family protein [Alistipes sp.]